MASLLSTLLPVRRNVTVVGSLPHARALFSTFSTSAASHRPGLVTRPSANSTEQQARRHGTLQIGLMTVTRLGINNEVVVAPGPFSRRLMAGPGHRRDIAYLWASWARDVGWVARAPPTVVRSAPERKSYPATRSRLTGQGTARTAYLVFVARAICSRSTLEGRGGPARIGDRGRHPLTPSGALHTTQH
jgi:hypothetical protein